jgi:hypothetical protein
MIHYRLLNSDLSPVVPIAFRSIKRARQSLTEGVTLWAFASRQSALALAPERLQVEELAPSTLSLGRIAAFLQHHMDAKAIHPKYPPSSASSRRALEARYDWRLFGFDELGRAIDARQYMSVSCRWVSYSCPIEINNRRSNIRGLEKAAPAWSSILHPLTLK